MKEIKQFTEDLQHNLIREKSKKVNILVDHFSNRFLLNYSVEMELSWMVNPIQTEVAKDLL